MHYRSHASHEVVMYGSGERSFVDLILSKAKTDYANSNVGFSVLLMLCLFVLVFLILVFSVAANHEIVWQR